MKTKCISCKRKWFLNNRSFIKKNKGAIEMFMLLLAGLLLPGQKEQPEIQGKHSLLLRITLRAFQRMENPSIPFMRKHRKN